MESKNLPGQLIRTSRRGEKKTNRRNFLKVSSYMAGLGALSLQKTLGECLYPLDGDIDGDCEVNLNDLHIMSSDWLTSDSSARSNLDSSYSYIPGSAGSHIYVDYYDFEIMARDWGKNSIVPDSARSAL